MEGTSSRPTRFHLSLRVAPVHLSAMVDFYTALFGVPPRKQHLDHVQFDLLEPALNLSFVPRSDALTGELDHLGIQVFSAVALEAARSRVRAAGLTPREEPDVDCCYASQNRFWLADPEGREVEVFHKLADLGVHGHRAANEPASGAASLAASARDASRGALPAVVLFACVHNAGRSQMAAAFFNALADGARARATSAGTQPADRVHPEVLNAMREAGQQLSGAHPQQLTHDLARSASLLVTMGCGEQCPVVPGLERADWPLPDPKGQSADAVRAIRDEVRRRVVELLARRGWAR